MTQTRNASALLLYPNPTNGQLRIKNEELRDGSVIEIFNIVRQKLLSIPSLLSQEQTIDVESLAKGTYFLKIGEKTVRLQPAHFFPLRY